MPPMRQQASISPTGLEISSIKLKVGVSMTAGLYEGATFYFLVTIPPSYPFHAPSAVCTSRAWHPNIDLHSGFVSLP
ncbi:unnamed protein product, partial [Ascophyllum nodosum]